MQGLFRNSELTPDSSGDRAQGATGVTSNFAILDLNPSDCPNEQNMLSVNSGMASREHGEAIERLVWPKSCS